MLYSLSMTVRMARAGMPPPWKLLPVGLEYTVQMMLYCGSSAGKNPTKVPWYLRRP